MAAAAPAPSSCDIANEGPVLNLINKRLRALRKKLNRIAQMEDAVVQGKTLNKEQEETLRSKPSVLAGIDELEKIRQPLLSAVDQEIELALEKNKQRSGASTEEDAAKPEAKSENDDASAVSDLLKLLYFGSVFDVKTLMRVNDNMLTRTHERNCCLSYDYVTDDDAAADLLKESDLDLIALVGGLLISRPMSSSLSHKDSLENCVEHAKLWLANADQPIEPDSNITYASLKEKLNKIMASDYFTTTPEIKAPVEVAAAAGNYTYQVPVYGTMIPPVSMLVPVEGSGAQFQHEEKQSPNSHGNEIYGDESRSAEELHQGGSEVANPSEDQAQTEHVIQDAEADQNSRDADLKEQHGGPRRPYQNYKGGRGGGGGRRGYSNGHGGRGGSRGGYQTSRGQIYDQPSAYQQRNFRGRGGRGMGPNFNYQGPSSNDGHAQAAS